MAQRIASKVAEKFGKGIFDGGYRHLVSGGGVDQEITKSEEGEGRWWWVWSAEIGSREEN